MSCVPTPTATEYGVVTTFSPSTSYSQSAGAGSQQVTTIVQQTCVASGTINGSSVGCISTAQVTQVNTVGGGGQTAQVPIVVTVAVAASQPTQTLFAPCTGGDVTSSAQSSTQSSTQSSAQSPTDTYTPLTTSVLVQSTPPPSTIVEASSTTLANGSVMQTVVTVVSTLPPTSVYIPTSIASPTLQNNISSGSGTNVAPIVGGVLGGFLGLIAIVGSLWWLCRRRRTWDDIFEKEEVQNDDAWVPPVRPQRDSRRPRSSAEPRPYQYGLVGHVMPPAAAGESVRSSHYGSVSEHSGTHSRHTSFSATPLLQATRSSRPSTAASMLTVQTQSGPRALSPVNNAETEPRSLSMVSYSNGTGPRVDSQSTPALLSNWTPNTDNLADLDPLARTGSPISSTEQPGRILQIVNDSPPSPSPTETVLPRRASAGHSSNLNVIVHTDGGPVLQDAPPAYAYAL